MYFLKPALPTALLIACLLAISFHSTCADTNSDLSLAEILQRHLQALGGAQALTTPKSERIIGTIEEGGLHGTYTEVHKGEKYWAETKIGIEDSISGYDGKVAWQCDSNGNVRPLSSGELLNLHDNIYFYQNSYLISGGQPGRVSLRAVQDRKTGDYLLDVTPEGGKACLLYIDPKTFLEVKEQHYDDNLSITETGSDFKPINGVMTATVTHISNGDRKSDETDTLTDYQINVDAPDSLFTMPVPTRNYTWVHPEAPNTPIPYDANDDSIKLFTGINGAPAYLTLDSGASNMAIAKWATDYLKIGHQGTFRAQGYGGSANIYPVSLDTLEIADGVIFKSMTASAIDLPKGFDSGASTPSVGFLGYELLSRFVVQIDFQAQHVILYDPETWKPSAADGTALPMEIDDNVPTIMTQVDGMPARLLIDTGDAGAFVRLYHPFVTEHRLDVKYAKGEKIYGMGVGGVNTARRVRCASFTLAGMTMKDVPIDMALDDKGGASKWQAGALGFHFLSHFTITFDYPHQRVFFAPNAETPKPFDTRTSGLYVTTLPDANAKAMSDVVVVYVDTASPAYRAGIVPGDTITQVDGQSAASLGLGEIRRLLSPEGEQNEHELSIIGPQGGTGKVKVALYDPLPNGKGSK